jgi:hypothetical protein
LSRVADPDEPRVINPFLLIGLYSAPLLFVWFLFGRGYALSTRRAVFIYALTLPFLILLVGLIDWISRL